MQTIHYIPVFRSSSTSPVEGVGSSAMTTGTSDSTSEDRVVTQLMDVLTEFGLNEGSDYTREELEEPVSLSEAYPKYTSTTSNKMDEEASTTASAEDIGEDCDLTSEVYWYHPNYLGNVDLVTDIDGKVHQFFLYTAWGEELNSYTGTSSDFDSPYRFNGKELDQETGLAYYGARYYDNQLSMWLSVDPLAHEFQSLTPYHFVANNPVSIVDPNGMDTSYATGADWRFINQLIDPNSSKYDKDFADKVDELASSSEMFEFRQVTYQSGGVNKSGRTYRDPNSGNIVIAYTRSDNPNISKYGMSEYSALYEETFHAWDYETGGLNLNQATATDEAQAWKFSSSAPGTKIVLTTIDQNSGTVYLDYTPMYRISISSEAQVANWLKYGMSPKLSNGRGYMGMGIYVNGVFTGIYHNLPLR